MRPEAVAIEQLALEGREETLAQGVVVGSPTLPIDDRTHASRQRVPKAIDVYCPSSTGRRNTACVIRMMNDFPRPALVEGHVERGDFGLRKLTAQQSSNLYDVLVEHDRRAATIITSNRAVDEWVALFDDPILANSALDRFAHRAHQIVMDVAGIVLRGRPRGFAIDRPATSGPRRCGKPGGSMLVPTHRGSPR